MKSKNDLKIGDRVRVISVPELVETFIDNVINGMTGTVKQLIGNFVGVEFDDYMGGHDGDWNGKQGYCWYVLYENLEKIEETNQCLDKEFFQKESEEKK